MSDDPNWNQASRNEAATAHECPWCTNDRDLERRGAEWFCPVCSRQWFAYTLKDLRMLRVARIGSGNEPPAEP